MLEMWHEKLSKQDDDEPSNGEFDLVDSSASLTLFLCSKIRDRRR